MTWWRRIWQRRELDEQLDKELRFHIESRATELEASGIAPADALAKARREFGSATRASEESRAAWQFRWIEDLFTDLRYGLRSLRRSPGFALTAVLSLALGIGATRPSSMPFTRSCGSLCRLPIRRAWLGSPSGPRIVGEAALCRSLSQASFAARTCFRT